MLGTDKSRGFCLEMICADFLAGAHFRTMATLRFCSIRISRFFKFLPGEQQQAFLANLHQKVS